MQRQLNSERSFAIGLWTLIYLLSSTLPGWASVPDRVWLAQEAGSFNGPPASGDTQGDDRDPCNRQEQGLTPIALIRTEPNGNTTHWGHTEQARPALWAYIPYGKANLARLEVSLRTSDNQPVYTTVLTKPETPGIIAISLAEAEADLAPGEWYQWYIFAEVYCSDDPAARLQPDSAQGWIQRRSREPEIPSPDPWIYDRLEAAANDPQALQELLNSIGQAALADRPPLNCCQPRP